MNKIKIGAVVYAPQVKVIWDIISKYFKELDIDLEVSYFENYKTQIEYLLENKIDITWNSPLAHVLAEDKSKNKVRFSYMRDTDQNRESIIVVRKDSGIKKVMDLKNKKIGFGAIDSPQARLIPIISLKENNLEYNKDYKEVLFNIGVGLHGDHEGGEKDALLAMIKKEVDASVTTTNNWNLWVSNGTIDTGILEIVHTTTLYDHCIFTIRENFSNDLLAAFEDGLAKMNYENPEHKEMMDLEGLKKWVPGRTNFYKQLRDSIKYLDFKE